MTSEHRKIELQSPADLAYITSLIRLAATKQIDKAFPPNNAPTSEPDALRSSVEDQVNLFVSHVLAGLRKNISINGLDVEPEGAEGEDMEGVVSAEAVNAEEEFEDFDEPLRQRLQDAMGKREKLVERNARHRRETPGAAAAKWQASFKSTTEAHDAVSGEMEKAAASVAEEGGLDVSIKRQEEVERSWERAVEGLGRLKGGLPETRARLERCGDVVGYLEGQNKKRKTKA
ncbi:hypothetical protein P154DRAFT_288383 [Amniculicola lignicola CBS 123094]|uniref:Mis14-domain-containing protein n=1 Tax=Amniculicola lignicola CBS 123094 TaxID=1392246 RepID=A0A6A5WY55_9PLEO|nr:hypothetical protein P154DRAFT_288383 [Amniculicola lignicola CBS 123094]